MIENHYAVMRFQKYKLSQLGKIERHNNDRKHLKNREHKELEHLNITFKHPTKTLTQQIREKIKEIKEQTGKTTRKDAAVIAEFIFTFSPEMTEIILKRKKEWIMSNAEWIKENFEKNGAKLLRLDLHMDETTPHIHAFVQMTDDRGLFNASKYFGKKKQLEELQTSYAEKMAQFGLERGRSKKETKAKHQTLNEYYKQKNEQLKNDIKKIEEKQEEINQIKETILEKENEKEEIKRIDSELADDILI